MTSTSPPLLLENLPWLRSLARRLTSDRELAEDSAQDACVAALTHEIRDPARLRHWLAAILRNGIRQRARADRARAARERRSARADPRGETPADVLQRAEIQQDLIAAVLALDEPYRTTVLLRFFDRLPQRGIAERMRVPVATVNSRLTRALAQLRVALDRRYGDRDAWRTAFAPLLAIDPLATVPTLGVTLMNMKLACAGALLAVTVVVAALWSGGGGRPAAAPEGPRTGRAAGELGTAAAGGELPARREPWTGPAGPAAAASRASWRAKGRVFAASGSPLAGVAIGERGGTPAPARSNAAGAFELVVEHPRCTLVATDPTFVTVLAGAWSHDSTLETPVVVAPALEVTGTVRDEQGAPLGGARVTLELPQGFEARFSVPLDRAERVRWATTSEAGGAFELRHVPQIEGARLVAALATYLPGTAALPPVGEPLVQIVLQQVRLAAGELSGRVIDPLGAPVEGARVALGLTSVVSGRDGRFGIAMRRAGHATALVAAKPGYLPARLEPPRSGGAKREEWPERIELRLGEPPLTIRGHVRDQAGAPIAGALVWVDDPQPLGVAGILPLQLEYVLAGGGLPRGSEREAPSADEPLREGAVTTQMHHAKEPTAAWFYVTTDAGGAFEVPGLLRRDYVLKALDTASALVATSAPVPAGSVQVPIVVAREGTWPLLTGRVVSLRHVPLEGVHVLQVVRAFAVAARVPGGRFEGKAIRHGQRVRTDGEGRFSLRDVGKEHCLLSVYGDAIMPQLVRLQDVPDPAALTVVCEARCFVEVRLREPGEADRIAASDAAGETVEIALLRSGSTAIETDLALHDGRSGSVAISERATRLVLSKSGKPVRTAPLALEAGKTFVVE